MQETRTTKVLVIDDPSGATTTVPAANELRAAGFDCVTAGSTVDAIVQCRGFEPDVIVTDLRMPALSGVALVGLVRSHTAAPIIAMTGFPQAYRDELGKVPGVTLLAKPFEAGRLIAAAERLVGHAKAA